MKPVLILKTKRGPYFLKDIELTNEESARNIKCYWTKDRNKSAGNGAHWHMDDHILYNWLTDIKSILVTERRFSHNDLKVTV